MQHSKAPACATSHRRALSRTRRGAQGETHADTLPPPPPASIDSSVKVSMQTVNKGDDAHDLNCMCVVGVDAVIAVILGDVNSKHIEQREAHGTHTHTHTQDVVYAPAQHSLMLRDCGKKRLNLHSNNMRSVFVLLDRSTTPTG